MATQDVVTMAHGGGGRLSQELIAEFFAQAYGNEILASGDDAAVLDVLTAAAPGLAVHAEHPALRSNTAGAHGKKDTALAPGSRLAFSTDSYVISPHFFAGGDIGRLAVCGTVNDVCTAGAKPLYLALGFILEEGFLLSDLRRVCASIAAAASEADVLITTGDTKVVERGKGDGIYINSTGIGIVPTDVELSGKNCQHGDAILLSGTIGDHGITIISARRGLGFSTPLKSDVAPLNTLVAHVLAKAPNTRCFRDPTRGGVASTLNELACQSNTAIVIEEQAVPIKPAVRGACDMLGYDPLQVANEGKMIAVVPQDEVDAALWAMRNSPYGQDAALIGEVIVPTDQNRAVSGDNLAGPTAAATHKITAGENSQPQALLPSRAYVRTGFGSLRIMDMLTGEQLPRIC
ncbi:MAG: hydrogenase expression/formation protein HypE [Coriobacteriales bacterium]|jgi:hydrogenase expression/formation protein HypE|nr:hydrogenase expression/formation protein HypE [Coriobacteriales bacterium]